MDRSANGNGSGLDWENAYTTIATALDASILGDEIYVKGGIYEEALILKEGVALYGGFEGTEATPDERKGTVVQTVVDAQGRNTHAVVGANNALLDGFVLRGGLADYGGGLYCQTSFMTVTDCTITSNSARFSGGGVYCDHSSMSLTNCNLMENFANTSNVLQPNGGGGLHCHDSLVTLIDCTITGNASTYHGGGLYCLTSSQVTLSNCIITENSTIEQGGGISSRNSSFVLSNSTILNNTARLGGGLFAGDNTGVSILSCSITGNSADIGGGVYCFITDTYVSNICHEDNTEVDCNQSPVSIVNCLVTDNTAHQGLGGGVFSKNILPTLTNCTIAANTGAGVYSLMYYYDEWDEGVLCGCAGFPKLVNTILWDDQPWKTEWKIIRYEDSETQWPGRGEGWQMTYSCVRGGWPGEGNVESDPQFVDPGAGDYRLQPGSPCIDSGSNEAVQDVSLDLDGGIRVWNGGSGLVVDMGAYETASWTPEGVRSDLNGDGKIDQDDLFLFQQGWHKTATPVPTPEETPTPTQ